MARVVGVDGCRGGWVVVARDAGSFCGPVRVEKDLRSVFEDETLAVVAVDIPIGLLEGARPGGRTCEAEARRFLGRRSSSVFSAPARGTLAALGYEEAKALNRRSSVHGLAISQQGWAISGKVAEVDRLMSPALQRRVVEVHPEVSFATMNEGVPLASKKRSAGRDARLELLKRIWNGDVSEVVAGAVGDGVGADDVLDAMAAAWTAERVIRGVAERFPAKPDLDAKGLRMEIVR